jgi:hypothetical protein
MLWRSHDRPLKQRKGGIGEFSGVPLDESSSNAYDGRLIASVEEI